MNEKWEESQNKNTHSEKRRVRFSSRNERNKNFWKKKP